MLSINKISDASAIHYAADELRKYLRMMMPDGGDFKVRFDPSAKSGFRLGLMQDLGLDVSDAEDPELDDILYIDCDLSGGIIAGSNPRSVLLAVYEYLRQNGCRWLMPGVDGEYIPMQDIKPVKYRHKPSMRYRGWCNEGSESQRCMLDAIEFLPKVGMNVFMMEFRIPTSYYNRYYSHTNNDNNRPPEPVTNSTILAWKRMCEAELSRRGLQFHDIGHGWTADPFGIDSSLRRWDGDNEAKIPPESRRFLALVDGERKLRNNTPNYTSFCMSNPEAQEKFVQYIADYAEHHGNSDYLHVWLADGFNKQCECESCKKRTPSDWYMILLNMLDEELTKRKLPTRIVFIMYADSVWAPVTERLNNPARFSMLAAPISRKYTESINMERTDYVAPPFDLNKNVLPSTFSGFLAHYDNWKRAFGGPCIMYEYHFWRHQYLDPAGINLAKLVCRDVKAYYEGGMRGVIQDGSQRSFFPTGLAFYTYARALFDCSLSYEEIEEEYFSCAFGENWREFRDYLDKLGAAFDFEYMEGQRSANINVGKYYAPSHVESLLSVREIVKEGRRLVEAHFNSDYRIRTVSARLLGDHADYAEMLCEAVAAKALGKDDEADALFAKLKLEFGKREVYIEPYYDQGLVGYSLNTIFERRSNLEPIIELDN